MVIQSKGLLQLHRPEPGNRGDGLHQRAAGGEWVWKVSEDMVEQYTVYIPKITTAVILPNPTTINMSFLIAVSAEDQAVTVEPTCFQSNEIYSGEV